DEATRVGDLLRHFDGELELIGDGGRPPRVRRRAMWTIEGRVHFHPREALDIPLQVRALDREGMGVLGRNRPPRTAHPEPYVTTVHHRSHEKSRWVPHSLLWGGKRAARRAATISVWPTKQAPMLFMTCSITLSGRQNTARLCSLARSPRPCRTSFTRLLKPMIW